jgi:hypothetical protein
VFVVVVVLFGPGSASLGCLRDVVERILLFFCSSESNVRCVFISFRCFCCVRCLISPGAASLGCLEEVVWVVYTFASLGFLKAQIIEAIR